MTVLELRQKYPFKPYYPAMLDGKQQVLPVSWPYEEHGNVWVYCRTIANDPDSAEHVEANRLSKMEQ